MSWVKLNMKFPGTCIVCNKKINVNEPGMWQKGVGVKHVECDQTVELKCMVCGDAAGCSSCELFEDCNPESVSQACICTRCLEKKDSFVLYKKAVEKKFSILAK